MPGAHLPCTATCRELIAGFGRDAVSSPLWAASYKPLGPFSIHLLPLLESKTLFLIAPVSSAWGADVVTVWEGGGWVLAR